MRIEHVIYLSSAGCALWSWKGTRFAESPVCTPVGTDPGPVAEELRRLRPAPVAVLVDMTDEEHVRDAVARLGHRDQQALLERKLARAFPRTPYRSAQVQERSAGNAEGARILLSALTRPEPLRILLQRLADARLPVAGVFSPALLSPLLLDGQARSAPAVMLVLRRSNGRLQHAYFRNGQLAGNRRLRDSAVTVAADPGLMLRQVEESLRYFDPSFTVNAEHPLQVLLSGPDLELLAAAEGRGEGWQLRILEPLELHRRLRIRADVAPAASERMFIELLRRHSGVANFAPRPERRYFELFRVGVYGKAACLALAGAAVAGTLLNALAIANARREGADRAAVIGQLESVLSADHVYGTGSVDPLVMQQVVSTYETLTSYQVEPEAIMAAIGAAVSRRPRIQVDALQWVTEAVPAADGATDDQESGSGEEESITRLADTVTVTLRGHIAPFDGDFRMAFAELQAFVATLRENPAVASVTPRVQPLDVDPASTLSGELAVGTPEAEAPFTLEIALRPGRPSTTARLAGESDNEQG